MPAIFRRSITSPVRPGSCYRPSTLICPSVSLSLGVEWTAWVPSLSLCPCGEPVWKFMPCPCPARLLSSLSRLPPHSVRRANKGAASESAGEMDNKRGTRMRCPNNAQTPITTPVLWRETCLFFATCGKVGDKFPEIQETRRRRSHVKNSQEGRD